MVLSAPDGSHVGPISLAIWEGLLWAQPDLMKTFKRPMFKYGNTGMFYIRCSMEMSSEFACGYINTTRRQMSFIYVCFIDVW